MANWLDKYEQGGMVLKQKTKDNYGVKPNANDSDVTLPPGFKGLAYNTKGRNYSPAWGGQFAMGGSLPGATGMMYARTVNPAPSNGPYAKKTKASAQNGQEMKFYQEGLDFKPKTISQDGSIVTPYGQWEYPGEITTIPSNEITMEGVPYPVLGISDTGDTQMMYPEEDYTFDGESVTEYPIAQDGWLSKIDNVLSAPARGVTKLITGKYQDPSEALDIKNPYLKLATDMILDPVNLIGVGAVNKLTKLARGVKTIEKTKDVLNPKVAATLESMLKSPAGIAAQRKFGPLTSRRLSHKSFWKAYDELLPKVWDKVKVEKAVKLGATDAITTTAIINDLIQKYPEHKDEIIKSYGSSKTINQSKGQLKSQPTPSNTSPVVSKPKSKPSYVEKFGGLDYIEEISKPKANKKVKPQSTPVAIKQQPVPPTVERKQNVYEGTPVYSGTVGSGGPSALVGFENKGDTTYIKPEDYERFAVPKYGKQFIESKKKQRNGGVNKADEYPIEKLDQLLNFTNYNKPTKGGWLDKYN